MGNELSASEAQLIARGIAARLGVDMAWAFERNSRGWLFKAQARIEARRKIINAMRETLVRPRPISYHEIARGLHVDYHTVHAHLKDISKSKRRRSA